MNADKARVRGAFMKLRGRKVQAAVQMLRASGSFGYAQDDKSIR
jgi:hypothetical protein